MQEIGNHEKISLKYSLSMGHVYAYYFSTINIVFYVIKQENTKFTVMFPGKRMLNLKKYSKILPDLVISE